MTELIVLIYLAVGCFLVWRKASAERLSISQNVGKSTMLCLFWPYYLGTGDIRVDDITTT